MDQIYPRPDWIFRPSSKADFSERARNVAWLLEQPLQRTQEFLARVFGFEHLHALQAEMARVEADPLAHPPGPYLDQNDHAFLAFVNPQAASKLCAPGARVVHGWERDNHLLSAIAEHVLGDPRASLRERHWDIREIGLFDILQDHRVRFARVRDKWREIDALKTPAAGLLLEDYAVLETRTSGRRMLRLTPAGQAVRSAIEQVLTRQSAAMTMAESSEARHAAVASAMATLFDLGKRHPNNPWVKAHRVLHAAQHSTKAGAFVAIAVMAVEEFTELYAAEPERALPHNHHSGPDVDNHCFPALLDHGARLAEAVGKRRLAGQWRALFRRISKNEPDRSSSGPDKVRSDRRAAAVR